MSDKLKDDPHSGLLIPSQTKENMTQKVKALQRFDWSWLARIIGDKFTLISWFSIKVALLTWKIKLTLQISSHYKWVFSSQKNVTLVSLPVYLIWVIIIVYSSPKSKLSFMVNEIFRHCFQEWEQCPHKGVVFQANCFEGYEIDL